jgi:hypothetical protein
MPTDLYRDRLTLLTEALYAGTMSDLDGPKEKRRATLAYVPSPRLRGVGCLLLLVGCSGGQAF